MLLPAIHAHWPALMTRLRELRHIFLMTFRRKYSYRHREKATGLVKGKSLGSMESAYGRDPDDDPYSRRSLTLLPPLLVNYTLLFNRTKF